MKKMFYLFLSLSICFVMFGCSNKKTILEKLENFTEQHDEKVFGYDEYGKSFLFMYENGAYGNPQIFSYDNRTDTSYIYVPKKDVFVITSGYDIEESVTLYYDVKNRTATLNYDEYKTYDLSGCDSFESCVDEITDEFSKRGYIKKADELLKELNTLLEENDLSFEDIDVPFDELDK